MATYKVLQDIEAEDKFVGPLTLKQFILAGVTLVAIYLGGWLTIVKHFWLLDIFLLPIILVAGFLAFPWGRDQPTEIWLLAKLRFMLKPRRRIWDQSGMQELVTITAPKHAEQLYTSDNLSQTEVKSRLKALANTIDSGGWAVKNVNINLNAGASQATVIDYSDRLVDAATLTHEVPNVDIQAADDIMDETSNPTAQHLDQMIQASTQTHRQDTLQEMQNVRDHKKPAKPAYRTGRHSSRGSKKKPSDEAPADSWFMKHAPVGKQSKDFATFNGASTVQPGSQDDASQTGPLTADEQKLLTEVHDHEGDNPVAYGHTPVIQPISKKHKDHSSKSLAKHKKGLGLTAHGTGSNSMTQTPDPAILNLANNDDLSVATIARQANKKPEPEPPKGEVIISLR